MVDCRQRGPLCQTREGAELDSDDPMAHRPSGPPPPLGTVALVEGERIVATGNCAFLNPRAQGTVTVGTEAYDRLRRQSGEAKVSTPPIGKPSQSWPDGSSSPALQQTVTIDGQSIDVI